MPPSFYDPNSTDEQEVPLPSAPLQTLNKHTVLQPPLTRRGTGPGLIAFLPNADTLSLLTEVKSSLDPEPVQKWAEEGFVVVGITVSDKTGDELGADLKTGIDALLSCKELDKNEGFGVVVYNFNSLPIIWTMVARHPQIRCLVGYSPFLQSSSSLLPSMIHVASAAVDKSNVPSDAVVHTYAVSSPSFVLPQTLEYDPGSAALSHSRTLVFLRKYLGGPFFDIEAIWEEHTYFEFEARSVAKTMATMVAEPYVNHVPTMTGGVGRKNLTAFYRDHFIFSNPADARLQVVSRTVGPDRVVDEFVYHLTHDKTVDWLLPGVPPSGKKLSIPMMAVVNVRGDRLYNEHIWWDQATALRQAGVLPEYLPYPTPGGNGLLRLPVTGKESADKLVNESEGESNEMFGSNWGVSR